MTAGATGTPVLCLRGMSFVGGGSERPVFSVIMPTYNRAYVVWKAIASVVAQTLRDWELIVVDDGGADQTARVLEEFSDPRIRYLRVPHGGPSRARNVGLTMARADLAAYLDSDNVWEPSFLERFAAVMRDSRGSTAWYCGKLTTIYDRSAPGEWRVVARREELARSLTTEEVWALRAPDVNTLVHRRDAGVEIGGWDERCTWLEDWDFFLRLWTRFGGRCTPLPEILVRYRQIHGKYADGICGEFRRDANREVEAREYLIRKWEHHGNFDPRVLRRDAGQLKSVR